MAPWTAKRTVTVASWLSMDTSPVLGLPVGIATMHQVIRTVNHWLSHPTRSRLVTFTNVHMTVEANRNPAFGGILEQMDLNCPDGFPVYWLLRQKHGERVEKVSGPDFMQSFCEQSASLNHRHYFYGGAPGIAQLTAETLAARYPGLQATGYYCPPFRPLSAGETEDVARQIENSGANIVWVCLGCPKQEQWISDMRDRLPGKVFLAVGQAFDVVAGRTQRAPEFLSRHGGEWMYRLVQEPRRLWKRYLVTNSLFVALLAKEQLSQRFTHITPKLANKK